MTPGIDNNIDWTVPSTPTGERVGSGLGRQGKPKTARAAPATKRSVMDTLLGENDLAAFDTSGDDPYNATGKQFRR
jgi:hypothetical protein